MRVDHKNHDGQTALAYAANENIEVVRELIKAHADVNIIQSEDGQAALDIAAINGQVESVRELIKAGACVDHQSHEGRSALMRAIRYPEIVHELLTAKADINQHASGKTPLMEAARDRDRHAAPQLLETIRLLIGAGVEIDYENEFGTALHYAVSADIARELIRAGAKVNHYNEAGYSALMDAVQTGRTDVVRVLIAEGADVNHYNHHGLTALLLCRRW